MECKVSAIFLQITGEIEGANHYCNNYEARLFQMDTNGEVELGCQLVKAGKAEFISDFAADPALSTVEGILLMEKEVLSQYEHNEQEKELREYNAIVDKEYKFDDGSEEEENSWSKFLDEEEEGRFLWNVFNLILYRGWLKFQVIIFFRLI